MIRRPPRSTQSRSSAASDVYKRQSHEIRVEIILPDDDACPIDPFLAAPSLDVEDLLAMKCSFSENWEWLPTTDGGERLKNAMTTVVSTLSSPSFECSFAGKNEGRFPPVKRHNWEIFLQEFFSSFKARIEFSLSLSLSSHATTQKARRLFSRTRG